MHTGRKSCRCINLFILSDLHIKAAYSCKEVDGGSRLVGGVRISEGVVRLSEGASGYQSPK
jgi:hypothetical protein